MFSNNILVSSNTGNRPRFSRSLMNTDDILNQGTFTRSSSQYITDFEGETRKVESGSVAVEGSRVVTNLLTYSEDLSNAAWTLAGTASKSVGNVINFPAVNDLVFQDAGSANDSVVGSIWRATVTLSGSGTITLVVKRGSGGTAEAESKTVTLTATPKKYSISITYAASGHLNTRFQIYRSTTGDATSVTVHNAQLENVTAQQNLPGEYVKTTTAAVSKCFSTTNGNTVDGNGVVTEATGTALPTSYPEWTAEKQYTINDRIQVAGWWYYATNVAGPSGATAPAWPTGSTRYTPWAVTDGSMVWTLGGRLLLGYVSEPASTNKVTAYGLIPADTLGSELITVAADREFSSDTGWWAKGAGWTINGGVATFSAASSTTLASSSGVILTRGKVYSITYTITTVTAGGIRARIGGTDGSIKTTPGTYTETLLANTNGYVGFVPNDNSNISVDNVSIKEVQWAVGTKSFYSGSFIQNISGLTLSGDTAAVLSIVTDQTEIEKAGLAGINPGFKVYKLDNSAGSGWAYINVSGDVGNTNPHSYYAYARKTVGSPVIGLSASSTIVSSAYYTKTGTNNITPGSTTHKVGVNAPTGAIVYFLLPQLEESSFATSIMPTAGATATRAATSLSYPTAGNLRGNDVTVGIEYHSYSGGTTRYLFTARLDSSNRTYLGIPSGTNPEFTKRLLNIAYQGILTGTPAVNSSHKIIGRLSSVSGVSIFQNGVKGAAGSANTTPATIGLTYTIGDDGAAGGIFPGYLRNLRIWFKPLSDAKCIQLTQ